MPFPYASTDSTVLTFVASQNSNRGTSIAFAPAILDNGIADATSNNVIGFSSLATAQPSISMGTSFNSVIIDGLHSINPAAAGSPDNYYFTVDSAGNLTLTDSNTGQTVTISGVSNLIFNGAVLGTDANGNQDYASMYFIGNANQTEITQLYNAAFGRQPDLAGAEFYNNQLKAGMNFQTIAAEFMASPEFQAHYGASVSDTQFVDNLYVNVLHRAPVTSEVVYYQVALMNFENGVAPTVANPSWSRAQELLNFTNSPENQTDTAGFVINTAATAINGLVYADAAPGSQTAQQVITAAGTGGEINTALINVGAITSLTTVNGITVGPSMNLTGNTSASDTHTSAIATTNSNGTIDLSAAMNEFGQIGSTSNSYNLTVNGASTGGSVIYLANGTVNLFNTGNEVYFAPAGPQPYTPQPVVTITGFTTGDFISTFHGPATTIAIENPTTTGQVNTASLSFGTGVYDYFVNVGSVGSGSAAEVAAAAQKVYTPIDSGFEGLTFYGQITSGANAGGTAIYDWYNKNYPAGADTTGTHTVVASDFAGGMILVGVPTSTVTTATFALK